MKRRTDFYFDFHKSHFTVITLILFAIDYVDAVNFKKVLHSVGKKIIQRSIIEVLAWSN